jgi:hypothetical protein
MINNKELYEKVKKEIYKIYKKPSAFRSGAVIKKYKELGGTFSGVKNVNEGLARWFREKWMDVNPNKTEKSYPVFRPTKRITKDTPLTKDEISLSELKKQSKLKQKIKGKANLPKFKKAKS